MASTNKTPHYDLPQFIGTDKPSWLGDINGAMLAIDTALYSVKTDSQDAATSAISAQAAAQSAASSAEQAATGVTELTTEVAKLKTDLSATETQVTTSANAITQLQSQIAVIEPKVTQLQTDVQQAQTTASAASTAASAAQSSATKSYNWISLFLQYISKYGMDGLPIIREMIYPTIQSLAQVSSGKKHLFYDFNYYVLPRSLQITFANVDSAWDTSRWSASVTIHSGNNLNMAISNISLSFSGNKMSVNWTVTTNSQATAPFFTTVEIETGGFTFPATPPVLN